LRSRVIVTTVLVAALSAGLWLARPRSSAADDVVTTHLGKKIGNLAFTDSAGKITSLHDLKDKKAIVIVFLSFECPVSRSYMQPLTDMATEMEKKGVAFIGLTVNQEETPAEVANLAKEFKASFPIYLDKKLAVADALAAQHTPEAFVLDGNHVLRYRGRIDDSYYARLKQNRQITKHDLREALGEILAGKEISTPATFSVGCPINRTVAAAPKVASVTYHKDVLPILQKHCQECHRPGEVGPFSLMTYRQAVNWADDVKEYTQKRVMPPWKIHEGMDFQNERRLSDKEIATLAAWADGGTPEGDPKDAPPPVKFAEGWRRGTPDMILTVPEDFQLGPTGRDLMRNFVLPSGLTEDKYVEAVEVRAGNSRIVHHGVLTIDTAGQGRKMEKEQQAKPPTPIHEMDKGPGFTSSMIVGVSGGLLDVWVPGQMPRTLPEGTGIRLPKGSDIILQLHYHRDGRLEKDRTQVGLYFTKKKVERPMQDGFVLAFFLTIPAGKDHFVVKGTSTVSQDITLYDIMPHMHMLGKEFKVEMTPPDGKKTLVLHIKEWDYNWQETYYFKEPLKLKAGTKLDIEGVYDNSVKNPNNPFSPPQSVSFGEQTFNEMCLAIMSGTSERAGRLLPLSGFFGGGMQKDKK
jgi:peroxiredoxin